MTEHSSREQSVVGLNPTCGSAFLFGRRVVSGVIVLSCLFCCLIHLYVHVHVCCILYVDTCTCTCIIIIYYIPCTVHVHVGVWHAVESTVPVLCVLACLLGGASDFLLLLCPSLTNVLYTCRMYTTCIMYNVHVHNVMYINVHVYVYMYMYCYFLKVSKQIHIM